MKYSKAQIFDFIVLVLRWYLAFYMVDYGWAKLAGEQFGVNDAVLLNKPFGEIDKFHLAWRLFSLDRTFNIVVGLFQITGAFLIIINRTAILGALLLLPVLFQIFLVDLSFTTHVFGPALPLRLGGMMISDLVILFYYRERIILAFRNITSGVSTKFRYKWWIFILLPLLGFATDFLFALLSHPIKLLIIWFNK